LLDKGILWAEKGATPVVIEGGKTTPEKRIKALARLWEEDAAKLKGAIDDRWSQRHHQGCRVR
jgi:hypothetical protein